MADDPELKRLFQDIETDEHEMARFRAGLAPRLERHGVGRLRRWAWVALPAAAAAVLIWLAVAPPQPELEQQRLGELQTFVAASPDPENLHGHAASLVDASDELTQHNANMVLCLTRPDGSALPAAARGVDRDPRPEFREFYLEYLLDHVDGYQLNSDRIEERMERERDARCLALYARLLEMAARVT